MDGLRLRRLSIEALDEAVEEIGVRCAVEKVKVNAVIGHSNNDMKLQWLM